MINESQGWSCSPTSQGLLYRGLREGLGVVLVRIAILWSGDILWIGGLNKVDLLVAPCLRQILQRQDGLIFLMMGDLGRSLCKQIEEEKQILWIVYLMEGTCKIYCNAITRKLCKLTKEHC